MPSLVRWDPFQELVTVQRDAGRMFNDLGGWMLPFPRRQFEAENLMLTPTVDVIRRGEDMLIRAELPGVKPGDLDISVTENLLTLKGERREEHETKDEDYYVRETSWGTFERTLRLPEGADVDHIGAEFADGVLEITVPKAAHKAPETHRVEVATHIVEEPSKHH